MSNDKSQKVKDGVKKGASVAGKVIKWVLLAVLVIVVGICAYTCYTCTSVTKAVAKTAADSTLVKDAVRDATGGADKTKMAADAISVTAIDLYKAYDTNAVKADNTYKDKFVRVTGKVSKVDKDLINGKPYVKLYTDPSNPYMDFLNVYFKDTEMDKVADLENGKTVKIVGQCQGMGTISVQIKDSFFE